MLEIKFPYLGDHIVSKENKQNEAGNCNILIAEFVSFPNFVCRISG